MPTKSTSLSAELCPWGPSHLTQTLFYYFLLFVTTLTHLIPSHSVVLVLRQFPSSKSYLINQPRYEIDLGNQLSYG